MSAEEKPSPKRAISVWGQCLPAVTNRRENVYLWMIAIAFVGVLVGGGLLVIVYEAARSTTEGQVDRIGQVPWVGERISGLAHEGPVIFGYVTTYGGKRAYVSGRASYREFEAFVDARGMGPIMGDALQSDFTSELQDYDLNASRFTCTFPNGSLWAGGWDDRIHVGITYRESDGAFLIRASQHIPR